MKTIDVLKLKKQGISFGTKVIDKMKNSEEYSELISDDLTYEYVSAIFKEIAKDKVLLFINDQGVITQIEQTCIDLSDKTTIKEKSLESANMYTRYNGYRRTKTPTLSDIYILDDVTAFSEYIIKQEEKVVQEYVEQRNKEIENKKTEFARLIELGLNLNSINKLRKIEHIEKVRGSEVKKEEVKTLLNNSYIMDEMDY